MFKVGDKIKYVGGIFKLDGMVGVIERVKYPQYFVCFPDAEEELLVSNVIRLHDGFGQSWTLGKEYNKKYLFLTDADMEIYNEKGDDNMIKVGDLVEVVNAEGTSWEVGTIGTVEKIVGDVAMVITDDRFEIFNINDLEKHEKKAVYPRELFNIGDRIMANCTSDKGNYRFGDTGVVSKFRDDKDGADVGVKFDNKDCIITTWCYPENLVVLDDEEEEVVVTPYGKIKVFNLTSLLRHGWHWDGCGNLVLNEDYSISGIMLNLIDKTFDAVEVDDDNIEIIYDDVVYTIAKDLKGVFFKMA